MKKKLLYTALACFLISCSEKLSETTSTDSTSIVVPIADTAASSEQTKTTDRYNDSNTQYYESLNKEGEKTFITSETQIFEDSLLMSASRLSLSEAEEITIEHACGTIIRGNWAEPVYKISYKSGGDIFYGYTSQSRIACINHTLKSNNIVLLTLDYNQQTDTFIGEILLLNASRQIIGSSIVDLNIYKEGKTPYSFYYYFTMHEFEKQVGLNGITECFSINAGYDACGYPDIINTFLWNGRKLILAPETFTVSDAGQFYSSSDLYFPADSLGRAGYIVEIIEAEEIIDGPLENREYYAKDSTVVLYKWMNNSYAKGDTVLKKNRKYSYPITSE